ncbi:MAG: formylmethanofuran--tetrahydromethanopterin N-formyltransferase [Gemmataceae bacterium]
MDINGVVIEDTFAEAFPMTAARIIVTAVSAHWARIAAQTMTGYATSIIGCDAEAGLEKELVPEATPDGRPGVSVLLFSWNRQALQKAVVNRIGQCVLTCATTACYNGLPLLPDKTMRVGGLLRYFGDGWQTSKKLDDRRFWRIPVMDGEFLCEDFFGTTTGVAGGNFLILAETPQQALRAAESAVAAIAGVDDCMCPFPGGIVRSGSKVASRYKKLKASTNDAYCPTLRGVVASALPDAVHAVYEIVIDALSLDAVRQAMRVGILAACQPGVVRIGAGNYGGKLGRYLIRLYDVLA